jgi:hypothetical protein
VRLTADAEFVVGFLLQLGTAGRECWSAVDGARDVTRLSADCLPFSGLKQELIAALEFPARDPNGERPPIRGPDAIFLPSRHIAGVSRGTRLLSTVDFRDNDR